MNAARVLAIYRIAFSALIVTPTRFLQFAASALLIVALDRALVHAH